MKSSSRQKLITLARILSVLIQFERRNVDLLTFYNKCIFCHSFSTEQIQVAVLHVKASHFSGWSSNVVAYFLLHLKKETSLLLTLRSSAPLTLLISTSDLSNHLSSRQTWVSRRHAKAKKRQTSVTVPLFFDGKVPVTDASNTVFPSADMLQGRKQFRGASYNDTSGPQ